MSDAVRRGSRTGPQDEVVIVALLVAGTKPADLFNQAASVYPEMRKGILGQHQIAVPIGLETRGEAVAVLIHPVFIAEDQIELGSRRQSRRDQVKRMLREQVGSVEQRHELSLGQTKRAVARG